MATLTRSINHEGKHRVSLAEVVRYLIEFYDHDIPRNKIKFSILRRPTHDLGPGISNFDVYGGRVKDKLRVIRTDDNFVTNFNSDHSPYSVPVTGFRFHKGTGTLEVVCGAVGE